MSEKYSQDVERGSHKPADESMSPAEKFLLFRDVSFVCIILLHIGTALYAIPALATRAASKEASPFLAVIIFVGILTPLVACVGYRDWFRISKVTSAIWFEFGWCAIIMVIDFIVAVAQSSIRSAPKTSVALTWLQTLVILLYTIGLSIMVLLQHHRFPSASVWQSTPNSVRWLRSPMPFDASQPVSPRFFTSSTPKGVIPPWQMDPSDMQEIKLSPEKTPSPNPKATFGFGAFSPSLPYHSPATGGGDGYANAHPFWQERVQRQAVVEDDMAYIIQRYGLNLEADKLARQPTTGGKHKRKGSIRDLEISRPVPVPSTVRRANTIASGFHGPLTRQGHQRAAPSLTIDLPRSNLDVPVDVAPPAPAMTRIHVNAHTRSLGLAGRTLIGTSRPKASLTRAHTVGSKPLPSPPAMDDSDESMRSAALSGTGSGSQSFVMGLAQRVQIGGMNVRPLMVATPKATQQTFKKDDDDKDTRQMKDEDEDEKSDFEMVL